MTGVDFTGPLYAHNESIQQEPYKVYVCLFICGVTRAIHLELTINLTAESFLQTFCCFASRIGLPGKIISDYAKTFTASAREVKKIVHATKVLQYFTEKKMNWEFIAEKAPWWGAFGSV